MSTKRLGRLRRGDSTLREIEEFHARHGMCPTVHELAESAGVSDGAMQQRLDVLERHGLIVREKLSARTTRLTPAGKAAITSAA